MPATAHFETGRFLLPADAPWLAEYEDELLSFPNGVNDDQVDATSYGVHVANEELAILADPPAVPERDPLGDDDEDDRPRRSMFASPVRPRS